MITTSLHVFDVNLTRDSITMQLARLLSRIFVHARSLSSHSPSLEPKYGEKGGSRTLMCSKCLKHTFLVVVAMSGGVDSSVTAALLSQDVSCVAV